MPPFVDLHVLGGTTRNELDSAKILLMSTYALFSVRFAVISTRLVLTGPIDESEFSIQDVKVDKLVVVSNSRENSTDGGASDPLSPDIRFTCLSMHPCGVWKWRYTGSEH